MEISYETIYDYLNGGKYPDESTDNQKRAIRNKAKKFSSQDSWCFALQSQEWSEAVDLWARITAEDH